MIFNRHLHAWLWLFDCVSKVLIILKFGQYISYEYEQNLSAKTVDTCIITIQTEI